MNELKNSGLDLGITPSQIFAMIIFSAIGLYYFRRGRRESNIGQTLAGLALMLYGYFTSGPLQDWGVGFGLYALAYYLGTY